MNTLRVLLALQLREWLNALENRELTDDEALARAQSLFDIHIQYHYELYRMLERADEVSQNLPNIYELMQEIRDRLIRLEARSPQFVCSLQENDDVFSHLISSVANYREATKDLRTWLLGTKYLTISDPYFFSFKETKIYRTESQYTDAIIDVLPRTLKEVEIFHLPGPNSRIVGRLTNHFRKREVKLRNYPTKEIHDRVWIKDGTEGKVVGTSFGGLGNKIAFILDLPSDDKTQFMQELHRIKTS